MLRLWFWNFGFPFQLGAPKAITAMAHKLAVLFYRMLRFGQEYSTGVSSSTKTSTVNSRYHYLTEKPPNWEISNIPANNPLSPA